MQKKTEKDEFLEAVKNAVPLKKGSNRVVQESIKPKPIPHKRNDDELTALRESQFSDFTEETILDTDDSLFFGRNGISTKTIKKLRKGFWTIQAELDLHGFRIYEAREETYNFLKHCIQFEKRCVRVIHGKGLRSAGKEPVLKSHVKSWLKQYAGVLAYCQAPGRMGGSGALIVLLKARYHRSLPS